MRETNTQEITEEGRSWWIISQSRCHLFVLFFLSLFVCLLACQFVLLLFLLLIVFIMSNLHVVVSELNCAIVTFNLNRSQNQAQEVKEQRALTTSEGEAAAAIITTIVPQVRLFYYHVFGLFPHLHIRFLHLQQQPQHSIIGHVFMFLSTFFLLQSLVCFLVLFCFASLIAYCLVPFHVLLASIAEKSEEAVEDRRRMRRI